METIHGLNTNGPAIIGTGVAFTILAVVGVGLRFSSKRLAHNPFGIDDWLLLFALVCYFATEILVIRCKCSYDSICSFGKAACLPVSSGYYWPTGQLARR